MPSAEAAVVVFAPDLADRSRIVSALPDATVARTLDEVREQAAGAVVVLDLSRPGAASLAGALVGVARRVVGFAPHVDEQLLGDAGAAGVHSLPRSVFFRKVAGAVHG